MTADTVTGASSAASAHRHSWAPLAIVLIGTFVFVLDFFVVNVALPAIQLGLHAGPSVLEWVVAGYSLTAAATLVSGGRLGDHYGRRRMFAVGLTGFVVASVACALAPTGSALVITRLLQGIAAGLMAPNVLSIIGVVYDGSSRSRAISWYGTVMGLAAASGQLVGGVLLRADLFGLGWRAIFWLNLPVGLVALVLIGRVPESRAERPGRMDMPGTALFTAAVTAIVLPLVDGRQNHWPLWSWVVLILAAPLLLVFALWQRALARAGGDPLLDLRVLARRGPMTGLTVQLLFWCQQAASYLFLALFLQEGRGLDPLGSGVVFTVLVAGYLLTSMRAPSLTERFGGRVILCGALVAAVGDVALAMAAQQPGIGWIVPGLLLLGAGQGLCITPLTTTVLAFASPSNVGTFSGALTTVQQVGNAVGVAVLGVVFFGAMSSGYGIAFGRASIVMAVLLVVVAGLAGLMGRPGQHEEEA